MKKHLIHAHHRKTPLKYNKESLKTNPNGLNSSRTQKKNSFWQINLLNLHVAHKSYS